MRKRIDDIEFLRGVAILFTLTAHLPALIGGGPIWEAVTSVATFGAGVDLFFVISGFVITRSLLAHGGDNFLSFALPFWIRRAWRLLPAAWLWLVLTLLATVYFNKSGAFGSLLPNLYDAGAAFLQLANFHAYYCGVEKIGLCANGGAPFGVYWSLSLEEQFYLLFPFLIFLTPRRYLAGVLVAIVVAQLFLPRVGTLLWELRTDGLLIGALLAIWHARLRRFEPAHPKITAAILITALAVVPGLPIGFTTGLLAVLSGGLVFIASFNRNHFPFMQWLGSRSYALYLLHFPVYAITAELWFRFKPEVFRGAYLIVFPFTAAFLLFLFAEATYRLVEMPMRERGRRISSFHFLRPAQSAAGSS